MSTCDVTDGARAREAADAHGWLRISENPPPKDGAPFFTFSEHAARTPQTGALGTKGTPILVMAWVGMDMLPYPVDEAGNWHDFHNWHPTHWRPLSDLPPPPVTP
jgi:hypothetical protein